jgi:predicted nucleic acid-binding protein
LNADWLLVDDLAARRLARQNFEKVNLKIGVKGTLGVIVTATQAGVITSAQAIESIHALENHPDIWLSPCALRSGYQNTQTPLARIDRTICPLLMTPLSTT